jgi:hypothetical protein
LLWQILTLSLIMRTMTKDREQYTMGYGPAATTIMALRTAQNTQPFSCRISNPAWRSSIVAVVREPSHSVWRNWSLRDKL